MATALEILGPRPAETAASILGPRPVEGPLSWNVPEQQGQTTLQPEVEKVLKDKGLLTQYKDGLEESLEEYKARVLRPTILNQILRGAQRGLEAGFSGPAVSSEEAQGMTRAEAGAAVPGMLFGALASPIYIGGAALEAAITRGPISAAALQNLPPDDPLSPGSLATAAMLGLDMPIRAHRTGFAAEPPPMARDPGFNIAREALAPSPYPVTNDVILPSRPVEANPVETHQAQATTVQELARERSPEVMMKYDALNEQRQSLGEQLENQRQSEAKVFQDQIDYILGKVNGVEDRLTKTAATRLETARHNLEYTLANDSPERTALRLQRNEADVQLREIAPDVNAAVRDAHDAMPLETQAETVTAVTESEAAPTVSLDDVTQTETQRDIANLEAQMRRAKENRAASTDTAEQQALDRHIQNQEDRLSDLRKRERQESASPEIQNLSQRSPTIAQQVYNDLRGVGQPVEVARANAVLTQAYYNARSQRFTGSIGNAKELFDRDAPSVVGAEGGNRGQLNLTTNTLRLFGNADASTFMHESAHGWLEQLLDDGKREEAPQDLLDDVQSVKNWLGMEDQPTRAQHEKFARGFERYLMEGIAPSPRLAGVFAKFKDWLTSIYRTVASLRAPITDEIRGVYDRLLSPTRDTTIIDADRGTDFAATHEADLAGASPETYLEIADRVRDERDGQAQLIAPETNNARRRARLEDAGNEPGTEVSAGEAAGPDAESLGTETAQPVSEVSASGVNLKVKGETPSGSNEPFGPTNDRLVGRDGRPVLDNIDSPDDIDRVVSTLASQESGASNVRAQLTDEQRIGLGDAIGIDPKEVPGTLALSEAEVRALTNLLTEAETDVWHKMKAAAEGGDTLALAQAIARLQMLQGKAVDSVSEWGRAGAAYRDLKKVTGAPAIGQLNGLLKKTIGMDYDTLYQLARQASQTLTTPRQVGNLVASNKPQMTRFGQIASYMVTNSYLSGPWTHTAYVIGNLLRSVAMHTVEQSAAGTVGAIREALNIGMDSASQGRRMALQDQIDTTMARVAKSGKALSETAALNLEKARTELTTLNAPRVYMKEAGATISGFIQGAFEGWRPAVDSYKAGIQLPLPGGLPTTPFGHISPLGPVATQVLGQPVKVVAGIHQFTRVQFYTQKVNELAVRQALDEGLNGPAYQARVANLQTAPTQEIMAQARDFADTNMYQRTAPYNSLTAAVGRWSNQYAAAKIIFPFMKINMEMLREEMKRIPVVGLALPEMRQALTFKRGGVAFDEAMGKQLVGVGLFGVGMFLASQDYMTGPGPTDPKLREAWLLNHQPNSLTIGNISVPIGGLGAQMNAMLFAASLWQAKDFAKEDDIKSLVKEYGKAVAHATIDEGLFHDVSEMTDAFNHPEEKGMKWAANVASGFVPYSVLQGQLNRHVIDPWSKETHAIMDDLQARFTGLSLNVEDRIDMFGNPIPSRGIEEVVERYANDPVAQYIAKIGVGPGRLDHNIYGVELTSAQYTQLAIESGHLAHDLIHPETLATMPHGMQVQELNRLWGVARTLAQANVAQTSRGTDNDIYAKSNELHLKRLQ